MIGIFENFHGYLLPGAKCGKLWQNMRSFVTGCNLKSTTHPATAQTIPNTQKKKKKESKLAAADRDASIKHFGPSSTQKKTANRDGDRENKRKRLYETSRWAYLSERKRINI